MATTCSKCGKKLGFLSASATIKGRDYCWDCSRDIPTCSKCHYFSPYTEAGSRFVGGCTYHEYMLDDENDVCEKFIKR